MGYIAVGAALVLGLVLTRGAAVARPLDKGPAASLYAVRDNGTDRRLVARPPVPARSRRGSPPFVRSPGGHSIAYVRDVEGVQTLFAADVSGANPVRLTPPNVTSFWGDVAFSPDGRRIAFTAVEPVGSQGHFKRAGLYVVGRNGDHLRFLHDGFGPSWAPDGRRVASHGLHGIVITDVHSGESAVISTSGAWLPLWSPRGDRIAYQMIRQGYAYTAACTVDPDGSRKRCLHGRSFKWLVWSPDGRRLAFKQVRPARFGIMDAYARHVRRLGKVDRTAYPVAWSPDGSRLAYSYGINQDAIRVTRVDGPQRNFVRVAYEPDFRLTDIRWRGHRISYIAR